MIMMTAKNHNYLGDEQIWIAIYVDFVSKKYNIIDDFPTPPLSYLTVKVSK